MCCKDSDLVLAVVAVCLFLSGISPRHHARLVRQTVADKIL